MRFLLMLVSMAMLLTGCSSVKTYPNTLSKNMYVIPTKLDSGSIMWSTITEFDIHRVNARCEIDYLGRVYLDKGVSTEVGIPTGEPLFLDFIFASKRFLSPDMRTVRYDTMLTARPGFDYRTEVSYKDGIYNVVIKETSRDGRTVNTIKRRPLNSCRPVMSKKD